MKDDKANWKALKENLCPMCRDPLQPENSYLFCTGCDFKIDKEKAEKIVLDIVEREHSVANYEPEETYSGELMLEEVTDE
jgi:uncharacterized Zn finger protein (UPF0148 family)